MGARQQRWHRNKMKDDPVYAAKFREHARAKYAAKAADPAYRERVNAYNREARRDTVKGNRRRQQEKKSRQKRGLEQVAQVNRRKLETAKRWAINNVDRLDTPEFRATLVKLGSGKVSKAGGPRMAKVCAEIYRRMWDDLTFPPGRWASIPGFPRVAVSDDGCVISCQRRPVWRPVKVQTDPAGYKWFSLRDAERKSRVFLVHVCVLTAFGPPRPSVRHISRHWDDNKSNNSISNLLWGTYRENALDALRNGKVRTCLSVELVQAIYQADGTDRSLSRRFGVGIQQVRGVRSGSHYADFTRGLQRGNRVHRTAEVRSAEHVYILTDKDVHDMRVAVAAGASYASLARNYKVSDSTVRAAVQGRQYKWVKTEVVPVIPAYKRIKTLPAPSTLNPVEHGRLYDQEHKCVGV